MLARDDGTGDAPGGLLFGQRNAGQRRPAQPPGRHPARVHGAGGVRQAGRDAADAQRQARSQGAARPGRMAGPAAAYEAPQGALESDAGRASGTSCSARAGRPARQLLRAGRPFAAGRAGGVAPAPGAGRGGAAARLFAQPVLLRPGGPARWCRSRHGRSHQARTGQRTRRCRSPSSACGSWRRWKAAARPTTCPQACAERAAGRRGAAPRA